MAEKGVSADPQRRVFRRSPFRLVALACGCLALAAIAGLALRREGGGLHAVVLAAAILAALWLGWRAIGVRCSSGDELRLDGTGFTLSRDGTRMHVPWSEVRGGFRAVGLWFDTVIVWTTDGSAPPRGYFGYQARAARGLVRFIPGDYHWNPYLLARILNRARRRALAER